ncbi:CDP-alcohol phosphatidyltransferase family protein [uncultured Nocardioides sp.]|uniref:CDP-alcohol phosphatidyltransferase family protein n=1 Tax=uncultured Nocardioides sp. TaxID=198441 RepID=UPI00261D17A9|nr:CDP-alcohol phosphatidyltransferase family protein [uncultured Nocardioides sp.]
MPAGPDDASDASAAYDAWSRRHGGVDPTTSAWVSGWVRLSHGIARPLAARGVSPDVVSAAGVLLTALVPLVCLLGDGWVMLGVPLVVASGLADGVDGALAALLGRSSAWGKLVDAVADRLGDLLLVLALLALGAPGWVCAAYAVGLLLHELLRAVAQAAGMVGPGAVTVGERPTRVVVGGMGVLLAGVEWAARALGVSVLPDLDAAALAGVVAVTGVVLTLVGLAQLAPAVRRALQ